ncbi:hypothetical protein Patl1_10312 [Pistacia atlantica]|uniref:Uncharacterized protein n=1 Tax=Pistacia atlantica TaxID=434234 RepID=A0ACC1A6X7_9ROSI|nr:hypothetical protein Patl1_10312 [Pistacia atlantica]
MDGHGTHTASTVAGRRVANACWACTWHARASPLARLAIYKACWAVPQEENAVRSTPLAFAEDAIANGALHAAKKNIVVDCALEIQVPPATLSNYYPWIITTGASSLDRDILGPLVLGNGLKIMGATTPYGLEKKHPLVHAPDVVVPGVAKNESAEVKRAGGAGYILGNTAASGDELPSDFHVLPGTAVSSNDANKIIQYIKSTKNPTAIINHGKTVFNSRPAPSMASFTSRGPNPIDPNLLKLSRAARHHLTPGLNILARWSEGDSLQNYLSISDLLSIILIQNFYGYPSCGRCCRTSQSVHPEWSKGAYKICHHDHRRIEKQQGQANN